MHILIIDNQDFTHEIINNKIKIYFPDSVIEHSNMYTEADLQMRAASPDLIVANLRNGNTHDGILFCKTAKASKCPCRILVLSEHFTPFALKELTNAGIDAFILTTRLIQDLDLFFKSIFKSTVFFSDPIHSLIAQYFGKSNKLCCNDSIPELTKRQLDYLPYITEGYTDEEISARMNITPAAVNKMRKEIYCIFKITADALNFKIYFYHTEKQTDTRGN